nr:immunoglobulin heavy chain junction region [Mus musculus]
TVQEKMITTMLWTT